MTSPIYLVFYVQYKTNLCPCLVHKLYFIILNYMLNIYYINNANFLIKKYIKVILLFLKCSVTNVHL